MRRRTLLLAAVAGGAAGAAAWAWRSRTAGPGAAPGGPFTDPAPVDSPSSDRWQAAVGTYGIEPRHDATTLFVLDGSGTLTALDRATGAIRWRVTTGVTSNGSLLQTAGLLIAGGYDDNIRKGLLVAVDPQGQEVWRQTMLRNIGLSTGLTRGGIVAAEVKETLYLVDAATGRIRWAVDIPDSSLGLMWPTADDDRILVEAVDRDLTGVLTCRDPETGAERWHVDVGAARWLPRAPGETTDGPRTPMRLAWLITTGQGLAVACRHRSRSRPTGTGDPFRTEVVAFDPGNGESRWSFVTSRLDQHHADEDTLYVSHQQPFDAPTEIRAFELSSGRTRWSYRTQGETAELLGLNSTTFAVADGVVCVSGATGLFVLDRATGALRWHARHPDQFGPATPVIARNTILVPRSDSQTKEGGLWRFRAPDGERLPTIEPQPAAMRLHLVDPSLYLLSETATLSLPLDSLT
ncbi:PQQ-binding-like beta-propeller repeat protein [Micromonospora musae]|uniref:outer membrane protein assembly factor BamB family protein n=1 Tax=Micromonospora musae TaxID=1894970 RepID=UPI0034475D3E